MVRKLLLVALDLLVSVLTGCAGRAAGWPSAAAPRVDRREEDRVAPPFQPDRCPAQDRIDETADFVVIGTAAAHAA